MVLFFADTAIEILIQLDSNIEAELCGVDIQGLTVLLGVCFF